MPPAWVNESNEPMQAVQMAELEGGHLLELADLLRIPGLLGRGGANLNLKHDCLLTLNASTFLADCLIIPSGALLNVHELDHSVQ